MVALNALIAGLVGIFIGGLLNVLADDLPHDRPPSRPHYPDGTPRPFTAWLGITAFLFGKRCPPQAEGSETKPQCLTWRYPVTELATAIGFAVTIFRVEAINNGAGIFPQTVNTMQTIFWLYYIAMFVLIVVIDIEHHLILFAVIIPSTVIAIVDVLLTPVPGFEVAWWMTTAPPGIRRAIFGAITGFTTFFIFYLGGFLYQRASAEIRGWAPEEIPFGYGDVMLITLCGIILGWRPLLISMFLTVFLGAIGSFLFVIMQKLRRKENSMFTALPYGPYIVAGAVIMLLFSSYVQRFLSLAVYG